MSGITFNVIEIHNLRTVKWSITMSNEQLEFDFEDWSPKGDDLSFEWGKPPKK